MGTAGWLEGGCCCSGMGTQTQSPAQGIPDTHQGECPPWGSSLGLEPQSPSLLSVGIQRARGTRELPCIMCRSHASRSRARAVGTRSVLAVEPCQSPAAGGGTARAGPARGCPPSPWGSHPPPTVVCAAGAGTRGAGFLFAEGLERPDERGARPRQPSPVLLLHLQSIRSPLKPGQVPASHWEKPERSLRPAARGRRRG